MLSEHGKDTPGSEQAASDPPEPGKVTEGQLRAQAESPAVVAKADSRPRPHSTGIMPGQFAGVRQPSSPIPMRMPSDEILFRLQGDSSIKLNIGLILSQAINTFRYRTQRHELCRHVIPKMMPLYCEAVRTGKIEAGMVFREGKGGMADVLYLFLLCNDGPQYGALSGALSWEGSQIFEKVRQSDEWLALRKAVLEADEQWRRPVVQLASVSAKAETKDPGLNQAPKSWQEIEIAFTSDERVEICSGGDRKTYNYNELGFEDRRNEKPNRAWVTLREIASHGGTIPRVTKLGRERAMFQKRLEEIRKTLRGHFKIQADPIPFNGNTYEVSFRLNCRRSLDT